MFLQCIHIIQLHVDTSKLDDPVPKQDHNTEQPLTIIISFYYPHPYYIPKSNVCTVRTLYMHAATGNLVKLL